MGINETEHRQIARDSLFVLVDLKVEGDNADHRVKMRNLSSAGMMAEGSVLVRRGMAVWVNLNTIGWTEGSVAWVQEKRFGIAFREEIDPLAARTATPTAPQLDAITIRRPIYGGHSRVDGPVRSI